ncbi:MAG: hypothetical protein OH316_02045, partial [Candidatus Parvarchaeota archaeon]|nr:hypothetical protein [Candidatus Parvarchaeota archaeon]
MTGEGLSRDKKIGVMVIVLLYFLVGFMLIVILLSKYLGPGDAGLIGILYLAAGWLVLYRWKGI